MGPVLVALLTVAEAGANPVWVYYTAWSTVVVAAAVVGKRDNRAYEEFARRQQGNASVDKALQTSAAHSREQLSLYYGNYNFALVQHASVWGGPSLNMGRRNLSYFLWSRYRVT
jgi:hypothetical protein